MSAERLRIGEVAATTGLTPRTIRWWERLGLVRPARGSVRGTHRLYDQADVERLLWIARARDLLGLPLEELAELLGDEATETVLHRAWDRGSTTEARLDLVDESLASLDRQLHLVAVRARELAQLEHELTEHRHAVESTPLTG